MESGTCAPRGATVKNGARTSARRTEESARKGVIKDAPRTVGVTLESLAIPVSLLSVQVR